MVLIGSDFHPSWQQVSWMDRETGETGDHKLVHEPGAVEKFYRQFPAGSRVGMEATGNSASSTATRLYQDGNS